MTGQTQINRHFDKCKMRKTNRKKKTGKGNWKTGKQNKTRNTHEKTQTTKKTT